MLIGKWKYVGKVDDVNGNHIMDAKDEYHKHTGDQLVVTYKKDGTLTFFYGDVENSNNWELLYNDTYLKISDPKQTGHNYTLQHIDSLTATRFVGRDTMYGRTEWNIYERVSER